MKTIKKLSIVIPVYNEQKTIGELLKRVEAVDLGETQKELVVINDGSTDATLEEVNKARKSGLKFRLINHKKNRGKSYALRTGFKYITGEAVVIQDGDMEYDPNDFNKMLKKIAENEVQVVYGSRRLGKRSIHYSGLSFYWGGLVLTKMVNWLYGASITDEPTCYKMFDSKLLKSIKLTSIRFEFCPEVTAKVLKRGVKIYEVPISYNPRHIKEGKKIRMRDFWEAVGVLISNRFR